MASHEHNLLPFGTPQSYPLLNAQSKAVGAANNKERLGECHDILCCRTKVLEISRFIGPSLLAVFIKVTSVCPPVGLVKISREYLALQSAAISIFYGK